MKNTYLIAEIGCNHKGDMDIAKEMIQVAKHYCQVQSVKFQKRTNDIVLSEKEFNSPHPNPHNSYGESYGQHRENLEFTGEQHRELKQLCDDLEIDYSTSIWDLKSAQEMIDLEPKYLKVPSACNTWEELIRLLCRKFAGELHISLGMATPDEIEKIIAWLEEEGRVADVIFYACTSGYPVEDEDVCLLEITRLKDLYSERVKGIGFSGHHKGIAIDIAAYVLGARWIERHYTLDRTWKGTDHAASLEPEGMRRLMRDLNSVNTALSLKDQGVLAVEVETRNKLKWDRTVGQ
jgi:N-acetylneuraminate synthase